MEAKEKLAYDLGFNAGQNLVIFVAFILVVIVGIIYNHENSNVILYDDVNSQVTYFYDQESGVMWSSSNDKTRDMWYVKDLQ